MQRISIRLAIVIICSLFAASDAMAETLNMNGLDNCARYFYSEIGGISAGPGNIFLVTGFGIEYNGENSVSIDPSFFDLKIDAVQYPSSGATYYLGEKGKTPLPSVTLYSGGKIERGYIAYEVPEVVKDNDFEIVYVGWEDIEILYQCV